MLLQLVSMTFPLYVWLTSGDFSFQKNLSFFFCYLKRLKALTHGVMWNFFILVLFYLKKKTLVTFMKIKWWKKITLSDVQGLTLYFIQTERNAHAQMCVINFRTYVHNCSCLWTRSKSFSHILQSTDPFFHIEA